jgi:hypothetical protein
LSGAKGIIITISVFSFCITVSITYVPLPLSVPQGSATVPEKKPPRNIDTGRSSYR